MTSGPLDITMLGKGAKGAARGDLREMGRATLDGIGVCGFTNWSDFVNRAPVIARERPGYPFGDAPLMHRWQ